MARCRGTAKTTGTRCAKPAIPGGAVCHKHGGNAPQVRERAMVRAELASWGVGDATDDPGETLLRLITQSRHRAGLYADLLQQAYDAAEKIAQADRDGEPRLSADARRDLDDVLSTGGVAVLVGKTYAAAGQDGTVYATGEAIRGLADLEARERDRCAGFCAKAITAGLAERMVKVQERQADMLYEAYLAALAEAGIEPATARQVMAGAARHLHAV